MRSWFQDLSTPRKVVASIGVLAVAAGIAGVGAFATFTSSVSQAQSVSSGTVTIALGASGGADNRLSIGANGLAAGDTVERAVVVSNTGTLNLSSVKLTTSATTSSLLDTNTTEGLHMTVDKCSQAWTESSSTPYTYTCGGTTTTVVSSRPVIQSNLALTGLSSLTAGGSDNLRVTLTLPSAAGDTVPGIQGDASVVNYSFTGTQRNATSQ